MGSKKIISFLTFGILLIIVGAILIIVKNSQGKLLVAIGLVFELLAALIFTWNKLKR